MNIRRGKAPEEFKGSEKEKEEHEIEKYGRFLIWEEYYNPEKKDVWLESAKALNDLNQHVLQDIEDYILLEGFKGEKRAQIKQIINEDHAIRVKSTAMLMTEKEGGEKAKYEKKQAEDNLKRQYLNDHRPPVCWNFVEDGAEKV